MTALITLRADLEDGEGEAIIRHKFKELSPLMRADIIKDWMSQLELLSSEALSDFEAEMNRFKKRGI